MGTRTRYGASCLDRVSGASSAWFSFVLFFLQVWLVWMDKTSEKQEKSIRQLAQEARQGNAHDENVLTYYR